LLHQHTADAHPKFKKSDQIRQQPARSQNTPSGLWALSHLFSLIYLMSSTQHFTRRTASEAGYALPHDYFRQRKLSYFSGKAITIFRSAASTASASLSTQNVESSPDYAPAVVRRLLKLQAMINSWKQVRYSSTPSWRRAVPTTSATGTPTRTDADW
jgi:hypothetical protein